jgi:hypothetical protein
MQKKIFIVSLFFSLSLALHGQDNQKEEKNFVQFSGLVVEGDSLFGVPGAHVLNPATRRATTTSLFGYFSIPVRQGDTLVIAAIGFKKKLVRIPDSDTIQSFNAMIQLEDDVVQLREVLITSFPSERVFKEALISMNTRDSYLGNVQENLDPQTMAALLNTVPNDGALSHEYYMQRYIQAIETRYVANSISLLNPFAWKRFFQDLKREKEKKEKREEEEEQLEGY